MDSPLLTGSTAPSPASPAPGPAAPGLPTERLINALQSYGVRLADSRPGVQSRRGGAGPSDHKAMTISGRTVMVVGAGHLAGPDGVPAQLRALGFKVEGP